MLRAIAEVGAAPTQMQSAAAPEPKPRDDAERRQLTVMFTDLVGSTALSTKLDSEDLRSVIGAYRKCVAQAIARFDGFVANTWAMELFRFIRMPTKTTPSAQFGPGWRSSGASELRSAWSAISSGPGGPGARHRWRDPQPCGTPAGHCRAEHSVIAEVKAVRQFVRASGPPDGPQGYRGAGAGLGVLRSALMSPEPDAARTEAYFERPLAVARAQQAKSLD
jgi:class 3 adenylate cyclase